MRSTTVKIGQEEDLIEQLRKELGASEDTEHLIDWLLDAWTTLEMLRERFGEARVMQLHTFLWGLLAVKRKMRRLRKD